MRKLILFCTSVFALMLLFSESAVQAQTVLWVSATGSGSSCTQTTPCATFQTAVNAGANEVHCLTSGNYGPVTITASLIIDCGSGNVGNISVGTTSNAITINTASAATIILRHLSLNGSGTAQDAIHTLNFASGSLTVEDCTIQGWANASNPNSGGVGIFFGPTAGRGFLQVSNTQSFNNHWGIVVAPQNNQIASVALNRVELSGNLYYGIQLQGSVVAGTMRDSIVAGNGYYGVFTTAAQVYFTVEGSSIVANVGAGILTDSAGSVVNVGGSTIGGNGTGVFALAGSLISFGDNRMSANGSNGAFTSTTPLR